MTSRGLQYDRQWGLFDKDGVAVTGRNFEDLLRVNTAVDGEQFKILLDGNEVFNVPVEVDGDAKVPARVFSGRTHGHPAHVREDL